MLTKIILENFKCFKEVTEFPLKQINLLTGVNGRGKSTLLQSLLLIRQSAEHSPQTQHFILNGNCVNLGTFEDIKNSNSSQKNIIMIYEFEGIGYSHKHQKKRKITDVFGVENPEAHLHPKAQSRLVKFLAKVSRLGVQVFIESHSDHILNALRIAVLDKIVPSEQANILYFPQEIGQPIVQIQIQPDGKIEEWPEGFFDQMDKDFERLFGV